LASALQAYRFTEAALSRVGSCEVAGDLRQALLLFAQFADKVNDNEVDEGERNKTSGTTTKLICVRQPKIVMC